MAAAAAAAAAAATTRVYVGGLGGGVEGEDMVKLFSPLGLVNAVDFVRSKGRAFAYLDFSPNSDKSLAKLFSTYNGCLWKGGRLRLEKAKEHYLERLKREWAEDAELPAKPQTADTPIDPCSSGRLTSDKEQLHIFFPKLRKVKALPFKGTGKHKYSFQRITLPSSSLPVHFCDCEEHSQLSQELARKQPTVIPDRKPVINEWEINIMNSVMNKLLENEDAKSIDMTGEDVARSDVEEQVLVDNDVEEDVAVAEDTKEEEDDDDNIVTNIGAGNMDQVLLNLVQGHALKKQKKQEDKDNNLGSVKSERSLSEMKPQEENPSCDLGVTKPKPDQSSETSSKTTPGASSWLQKSTWKDLIGESTGNSAAFSLSQILPGTVLSAVEPKTVSDQAQKSHEGDSVETKKREPPLLGPGEGLKNSKKRQVCNEEESSRGTGVESSREPERKPAVELSLGPVQSFVRSRESEKEWAKAKAALSGYFKRSKSDAKDSSGGQGQSRRS